MKAKSDSLASPKGMVRGAGGNRLRRYWSAANTFLFARAPRRPVLIFQSDDWGVAGLPSSKSVTDLKVAGLSIGNSKWDYYGLETDEDIVALGTLLQRFEDRDGRPACFTANFVMANADLAAMRNENFNQLRWVALKEGFPAPWTEKLLTSYHLNIEKRVFYPGLHGFTHFNPFLYLKILTEKSSRGDTARLLTEHNAAYIPSLTPDYCFAYVDRTDGEVFLGHDDQQTLIEMGIKLFTETFGRRPRTSCAPGYRANDCTLEIWSKLGIEIAQVTGADGVTCEQGLLVLHRNVFFEPVLSGSSALKVALMQARQAVLQGRPIVVCTHSINYISRHLGCAEQSRGVLRKFIEALQTTYPDLRFTSDAELADAWRSNSPKWWRRPRLTEVCQRALSLSRILARSVIDGRTRRRVSG